VLHQVCLSFSSLIVLFFGFYPAPIHTSFRRLLQSPLPPSFLTFPPPLFPIPLPRFLYNNPQVSPGLISLGNMAISPDVSPVFSSLVPFRPQMRSSDVSRNTDPVLPMVPSEQFSHEPLALLVPEMNFPVPSSPRPSCCFSLAPFRGTCP